MEADKPLISILLAVYEPRMDWLREQLRSLNEQCYPNLKLYIRDDCSPTVSYAEIQSCVKDCISAFPYEIQRNEKNLGSNGTFERLTQEAEGTYFAYCDQDDIWLPEKLNTLERELSQSDAALICSDVYLIDEAGQKFADSITALRPRHIFKQGPGLAPVLLYRNFVIGCTMLLRAEMAKYALPFAKSMVHDHYLAFFCALNGPILVSRQNLVCYRIHTNNQTSVLSHVVDKKSYLRYHMEPFCARIRELGQRFSLPELETAAQWAQARQSNAQRRRGGIRALWRYKKVNMSTTLFELVGLRLPGPVFRWLLHQIQAGKI